MFLFLKKQKIVIIILGAILASPISMNAQEIPPDIKEFLESLGEGSEMIDKINNGEVPIELKENHPNIYQMLLEKQISSGSLKLSPEVPKPGGQLEASFHHSTENITQLNFKWYKNGILHKSGLGVSSANFKAPEVGQKLTISVVATNNTGGEYQENKEIVPAEVDVLWETDTYTPILYKGKSLHTPNSIVKLVANPSVGTGNPDGFDYTWYYQNQEQTALSGTGKRIVSLDSGGTTKDLEIKVEVFNPNTGAVGVGQVTIESSQPEVVFYKLDPLYGVSYNSILGPNTELEGVDLSIVAEPYYFKSDPSGSLLEYSWSLNNEALAVSSNRITLRDEQEGRPAESFVSVQVNRPGFLFQHAGAQTNVTNTDMIDTTQGGSSNTTGSGFFFF